MPGIIAQNGSLAFGWQEDSDGRMFVDAKIGDLPASTTVAAGSAGVVRYANGGPLFQLDDVITAAPKGQFPAVSMGAGKKGDAVRVVLYGAVAATFLASMDTTANKVIKAKAGGVEPAAAATPDGLIWGLVTGAGAASKTHAVFLSGAAMHG